MNQLLDQVQNSSFSRSTEKNKAIVSLLRMGAISVDTAVKPAQVKTFATAAFGSAPQNIAQTLQRHPLAKSTTEKGSSPYSKIGGCYYLDCASAIQDPAICYELLRYMMQR